MDKIEMKIRYRFVKDEVPRLEDLIEKIDKVGGTAAKIMNETLNDLVKKYKAEAIELERRLYER